MEQAKNNGFLLPTANTKNQSSPKGPSFVVYSATSTTLSDLMFQRMCPYSSRYVRPSSKAAMVARPFFFPSPPTSAIANKYDPCESSNDSQCTIQPRWN